MDDIIIKPCTMKGFAHILPILETEAEAFDYTTKRQVVQRAGKALDRNPTNPLLLLAQHEGVVIGFIGFEIDPENPTISEMFGQVVKPGYQGQGVGNKLLQAGLEQVKHSGAAQVLVHLNASTPSTISNFYKKAGFKPSFDEDYTGASDQKHTYTLSFDSPIESTPPAFYPA